jgi:hypothetical protein
VEVARGCLAAIRRVASRRTIAIYEAVGLRILCVRGLAGKAQIDLGGRQERGVGEDRRESMGGGEDEGKDIFARWKEAMRKTWLW